jgi:hypothetical protein
MISQFHYSHLLIFIRTGDSQGLLYDGTPKGWIKAKVASKLLNRFIFSVGIGRFRSWNNPYFPSLTYNDTFKAAD